VVYTLPWYSRWWRRLTTRKTRQAGDRPKTRRRAFGGAGPGWLTSWITKAILIVVVVVVILTLVGPWHHSLRNRVNRYYHDVRGFIHPTYNPVHAETVRATSSAPGHPAENATDGDRLTSWFTGGKGTGQGQELKIHLGNSTNIDKVGFLIGDQDSATTFLTEGRPETVLLTFTGTRHPYTKRHKFTDSPNFQSFTVHAKGATDLTITIEEVVPTPPGTHAAIAEVELFKESY
jgi:hypothetical protein